MRKTMNSYLAAALFGFFLTGSLIGLPAERLHAAPSQAQPAQVVNLNKATVEELQTVRGIGPKLAERILKFREEKGKFQKVEDLLQVNGIGEAKFEKIKNQVSI